MSWEEELKEAAKESKGKILPKSKTFRDTRNDSLVTTNDINWIQKMRKFLTEEE